MLRPARFSSGWKRPRETRENLSHELEQCGYVLRLFHPGQTHHFHQQRGLRAKTDRRDAMTIARASLSGEARMGYVRSRTSGNLSRTGALAYATLRYRRWLPKRDPSPDRSSLPRIHPGFCRPMLAHCASRYAKPFQVLRPWSKRGSNPFSRCYEHSQLPILDALPPRNWWPWPIRV